MCGAFFSNFLAKMRCTSVSRFLLLIPGKETTMTRNHRTISSFGLTLGAIAIFTFSAGCKEAVPTSGGVSDGEQAGSGATPAVTWTQFQDPFESAFTVKVPQGWSVHGGLFRMGFSDERPMLDLTSPDGAVNVRLGDVAIPNYTLPNPNHIREGEIYDLGAQAQLVVARFRSGPEFAVSYAHVRFYEACPDAAADAANIDFTVPDYIPSEGTPTQTSTGQIAYRCAGGQKIAYAFARTSEQGAIWSVPTLGSFLAPVARVLQARAVLAQCAQTFHLNPAWIEQQKQMDAYALQYQRARQQERLRELGQQIQQFEAKMQAMRDQVASFERRQSAQASQVEGFTQALRGVTPTIDPFTGEAREVWTGPKSNYWTNGLGGVVNSTNAPAAGWRQMQITGP
jgi:hypothetical protein